MPPFDLNAASGPGSGIFGLPFVEREAALVYLPVPWEATVSYGGGTSRGPAAILSASRQVDLFDFDVLRPYEPGLFMRPESRALREMNRRARPAARRVIAAGASTPGRGALSRALAEVNALGARLNEQIQREAAEILAAGKLLGIVGGDHSSPFGALRAVSARHPSFGILHFDAHFDLRKAYEGFAWSHASIMRNVLENIAAVRRLVPVGIRDFCEEEADYAASQGERVRIFFDGDLARRALSGEAWDRLAQEIAEALPEKVWVSFDIDGLDPSCCPHTGTPVPGGLSFQQANLILEAVVRSGRKIIGFDLSEVSPAPRGLGDWDANVGARLLYKLSAWTLASQGLVRLRR